MSDTTATPSPRTGDLGSLVSAVGTEAWDYYGRLREAGPMVWDEGLNAWLVTSRDLVREVGLGEDAIWQSPFVPNPDFPPFQMEIDEWIRFMGPGPRSISFLEGEAHHRLHRWWVRSFTPKVLAGWETTLIEPIAHAILDRLAGRGHAELVNELARAVSPRVMTAVLGLPWEDEAILDTMRDLTDRRIELLQHQLSAPSAEIIESGQAATRELQATLMPYVEERRSGEGDDFISMIWRDGAQIWGDDFTALDVSTTAAFAFQAGSETTSAGTSNGFYLMLTQPEFQDVLRAGDDSAIVNFVEEALRLYSPVEFRPRRAKQDVQLGDVQIRKDEVVFVLVASASRDEAHYACPAHVDLERQSPRDHFGFYVGARTCPGQNLARMQMKAIFRAALQRLPSLRLDPAQEQPRFGGQVVRRWEPLNVLFDPEA